MIYSLNGERCTSSSRVLIQASIYDRFIEMLVARVRKLKVGDPFDPATEVGPLIHSRHLAKVAGYMDVAREDGAAIAAGGAKLAGTGYFFEPTLLSGANQSMRIAQEEIFGPVLDGHPFHRRGGCHRQGK